ncbi:MAG: HEAT repeat domain-containing protein [Candidatus Saganbacteria bacterium]|nr:HEAT repeat domain-containing protein [Candidatus Saganbacteria bacterium]
MGMAISNINSLLPILIGQLNSKNKKLTDEEIGKKLFSKNWMDRAEAAKEIGERKIDEVNKFLPELYRRLDKDYEKDPIVRVYVIEALGNLRDKESLPYLISVSKDKKEDNIVLFSASIAIDIIKKYHKIDTK